MFKLFLLFQILSNYYYFFKFILILIIFINRASEKYKQGCNLKIGLALENYLKTFTIIKVIYDFLNVLTPKMTDIVKKMDY